MAAADRHGSSKGPDRGVSALGQAVLDGWRDLRWAVPADDSLTRFRAVSQGCGRPGRSGHAVARDEHRHCGRPLAPRARQLLILTLPAAMADDADRERLACGAARRPPVGCRDIQREGIARERYSRETLTSTIERSFRRNRSPSSSTPLMCRLHGSIAARW